MKAKISISIDEQTLQKLESEVAKGLFRNKSHCIEYALLSYLKNE
jgi:Arc/MetJ-type ribon-helix-helix transcriptional regulator